MEKEKKNGSHIVIGIGASAGGVEALQQFFSCVPAGTGMTFVVIQHLSPDYRSLMADILSKYTDMNIMQAEDGIEAAPDTVYLNPPKKYLTIRDGHLFLNDLSQGSISHPIDRFFSSLAEEKADKAVAVILSGTGTDGSAGARAIKERGGIVIAQSPESAKFDGMPRNVIHLGITDYILTPEEIAEEVISLPDAVPVLQAVRESEGDGSEEEILSHIYALLKKTSGIDFTYYKRSTILRRIERRMAVAHVTLLSDYARILDESPEEADTLVHEVLIGVTSFFRDAQLFEKLKYSVIYKILEKTPENETIRVWCAGCSTGEEAYSTAILFAESMDELQMRRSIKIFATDVDARAIEKAGKGIFPESILEDVSVERLSRFFIRQKDQYQITREIRSMIIFAPHNIVSDPPFGRLDLIICRNVMIYFQPVLRRGLFAIFHTALKNGGYLFLGKSESAGEYASLFKPVGGAERIYMHEAEGSTEELSAPSFRIPHVTPDILQQAPVSSGEQQEMPQDTMYSRFLEKFLPASVVINSDNSVLHFFGNYSDYLQLAPGRASLNFFHMLNHDVSLAASTALKKCRDRKEAVTVTDIAVDTPSGRKVIDLRVEPLGEKEKGLNAVLFLEHRISEEGGIVEKYDVNETAAQRINDLEREFQVSQADLRATIQRLETVNGELQAANEELLTANEELQSSTEELQSVNEELYTVNTEHQLKLDELTMMTNDLSNFLSSTMIGILFVDSNLNIRKFTEYVGREFQLMDHDIGRPIQIFAHSFPQEEIEQDCRQVLHDLKSIDREVTASSGRFYTLRIAPYRTTENSIRGLVITIIDSLGKKTE